VISSTKPIGSNHSRLNHLLFPMRTRGATPYCAGAGRQIRGPGPDGIRRTGQARLQAWLKKHRTRSSEAVAAAAVETAKSQHTTVPAQHLEEQIVAALAQEVVALNEELADLDVLLSERVTEHRHTQSLLSMPGSGPVLGA
jgi:hypothetical protein